MEPLSKDSFPNTQAVILCGGLGTRLQERLPGTPKALARIGGRAFLEYLLQDLVTAGIRRMVLCTGRGRDLIRAYFGDGSDFGACIRYSEERVALGTGGALKNAQRQVNSNPFLVCNGDSLLELDFARLLARHLNSKAKVTLALTLVPDGSRYGNVRMEPDGRVAELIEKPEKGVMEPKPAWIYGGICVADQSLFPEIDDAPPAVSLERDVLPMLIGHGLFAEQFKGFFLDIGVPEDYERACWAIPESYNRARSYTR